MLQDQEPSVDTTISLNKATGETLGATPVNTAAEFKGIMEKARAAQRGWCAVQVSERAALIKKLSAAICENCDALSETISRDNGKTRVDALVTEVMPAAMAASYYAKHAKKFLKTRLLMPGNLLLANKISRIRQAPFGVIGIISPWNYPFGIPFSEVVMGLLAGNAVILKTATETQMVGAALRDLMESIGLPAHVFNYVNMPGRTAGDIFLEGGVDKLFFTGSVPVGKYLMKKAAETLTPVSLELGGNDPAIVCEDADLRKAADGITWAGFQNAGQSCGGVERVYVHEAVYEPFMALLKKNIENLNVGYDEDFNVDIGVMTTRKQCLLVQQHLDDALEKGAVMFARAKEISSSKWKHLVLPSVLSQVTHEMQIMKEETFGPVIGVMKIKEIDEGIRLANDSNLGLTASVWSSDRKKAIEIASKIQAGAVTVNDHLMSHGLAETPWGGFKESGIGRTHGEIGFAEMTEPQVIVSDIMPFAKRNMWWYPHGRKIYSGMKGTLVVLYGSGAGKRLAAFFKMTGVFLRTFFRGK